MSADSSRKPSGSSTRSGTHSPPSAASGNAQTTRNLASGAASSNLYGIGGGNGGNLKALSTGWQVWGSSSPSSKRNASMSSLAGAGVGGDMQGDSNFRPNVGEPWSAGRSASGTWDDSALQKDFSSLDNQSQLNLRQTRQRQSHAGQFPSRADDRPSGSKNHHSNVGKDSNPPRYSSSTKPLGAGAYPKQQPSFPLPTLGYDSLNPSGTSENDLNLAMRGMAVADDSNALHSRQQAPPTMPIPPQVSNAQMRGASSVPQQRNIYNTYPTAEYGFYPPARDSFADYSYVGPYGGPDPSVYGSGGVPMSPSLYPAVPQNFQSNTLDIRQQQPAPMMYPPQSPMMSSQLPAPSAPVTLQEKKLEMQYNLQQQLASRNLMFRAAASPQAYGAALDYGSQMLNAANMYSNLSSASSFGQPMRGNRRPDMQQELASTRSPMDIANFVVEFSGDQHGSRFIQNELITASSEERQSVFDEIVPDNTLQLIQDVFGNYVIQKLFEHGTQAQKTVLANTMEGHVFYLSCNLYGCRVVQKAIETILPEQQASFVRELEPHIMKCVKDSNGNHVIQKVIERVSPDRLGFVSTFIGHVFELASHPFGCRVLQRCLEHLPDTQTRPLLDELLANHVPHLMQDQFDVKLRDPVHPRAWATHRGQGVDIIAQLRGRLLFMARHKFASNVCEKALINGDSEARRALIEEIMAAPSKPDAATPIVIMMKDQYGNYVLQRALQVAEGEQKETLINTVRPQLLSMRRYSTAYSKHLTSIERELEKLSPSANEPAR
ncbi:PUM-HD domain-containing protein [Mycena venus]|uniref:PUM-HD domain-containing protein n=1 Tax=Mycena venus TaxID=2733690 RepID=A0A8H6XCW2_9AGAR|nr:PUM-HD domain-containing protein [Mycena venus]